MPKSPESEILAKFFADMGEKCCEKMAKFFADFRPSISRKSGRKKFHEKLATNSAGREIKFFHRETLGVWGHKIKNVMISKRMVQLPCATKTLPTRKKSIRIIFEITVTRSEFFQSNFGKLPDTYCIYVSCETLPA